MESQEGCQREDWHDQIYIFTGLLWVDGKWMGWIISEDKGRYRETSEETIHEGNF